MKLSVTIIAFNEEQNLARALKSVAFADEIIVVDSFSSDKTTQIAEDHGAKVYQKEFLGYGQQKNYAASKTKGEWILSIDADEEVTPELQLEIKNVTTRTHSDDVYQLNRITNFCGRWIKHGGWYPDFLARLAKREQASWSEPHVHEELVPVTDAKVGKLIGHLNHYSFPTIQSQIQTNLKFSELGAKALVERKGRRPNLLELVIRPLGKFIECYIIKSGWLDGKEGFIISVNAMHSMFMKYSMAIYSHKKG